MYTERLEETIRIISAGWATRFETRLFINVPGTALHNWGRDPEVVRAREILGLVGTERFGVTVGELVEELGKSRGGVTQWYRRGVISRDEDPEFPAPTAARLGNAASEDP